MALTTFLFLSFSLHSLLRRVPVLADDRGDCWRLAHYLRLVLESEFALWMPPRKAAAAAPASTASPDHPFADAEARIRSASETARRRLAALVAATRRVLAALAADPSAVETGPRVELDDEDDDDDGPEGMVDADVDRGGKNSSPKPLVRALSESVEDLLAARAALRASVEELRAAESLSESIPEPARGAEASSRSGLADALEPAVAALRATVSRKNSAVAAMADSLAALVSDVDSWRVSGPGAWPRSEEEEEEGEEGEREE